MACKSSRKKVEKKTVFVRWRENKISEQLWDFVQMAKGDFSLSVFKNKYKKLTERRISKSKTVETPQVRYILIQKTTNPRRGETTKTIVHNETFLSFVGNLLNYPKS